MVGGFYGVPRTPQLVVPQTSEEPVFISRAEHQKPDYSQRHWLQTNIQAAELRNGSTSPICVCVCACACVPSRITCFAPCGWSMAAARRSDLMSVSPRQFPLLRSRLVPSFVPTLRKTRHLKPVLAVKLCHSQTLMVKAGNKWKSHVWWELCL